MFRHLNSPVRAALLAVSLPFATLACGESPTAPDRTVDLEENHLRTSVRMPFGLNGTVALVGPVVPADAACAVHLSSALEGRGRGLGRFSGVGQTCILSQLAPDPDPPFTAPGPPPYATARFTNPFWKLTAEYGHEVWLESIEAVAVISLVDQSLRARGAHRVVGGTGRFEGAEGRLVTRGVNEDGLGPDDFVSRGWIRLVGDERDERR